MGSKRTFSQKLHPYHTITIVLYQLSLTKWENLPFIKTRHFWPFEASFRYLSKKLFGDILCILIYSKIIWPILTQSLIIFTKNKKLLKNCLAQKWAKSKTLRLCEYSKSVWEVERYIVSDKKRSKKYSRKSANGQRWLQNEGYSITGWR